MDGNCPSKREAKNPAPAQWPRIPFGDAQIMVRRPWGLSRLARRGVPALMLAVFLRSACAAPGAPQQAPGGQSQPAQQPRRGGVLRSAELGGAPKLLHPYPEAQQLTTPWSDAATLMWASLIDFDSDTLDFIIDPRTSLATSLPAISNNGRTFTFTLRDYIKW